VSPLCWDFTNHNLCASRPANATAMSDGLLAAGDYGFDSKSWYRGVSAIDRSHEYRAMTQASQAPRL
jgi:hypothetical protein